MSDFSDTEIEKIVLKRTRFFHIQLICKVKYNDMEIERSLYFYILGFEDQFTKELEVFIQGFTGTKEEDGSWMFRMNGKYL